MKTALFDKVLSFLRRLEENKIAYDLKHSRPEAITVNIDIPGQRWEVDFLADGDVDVERFISNGEILDEPVLEELFALCSDKEDPVPAAKVQNDAART